MQTHYVKNAAQSSIRSRLSLNALHNSRLYITPPPYPGSGSPCGKSLHGPPYRLRLPPQRRWPTIPCRPPCRRHLRLSERNLIKKVQSAVMLLDNLVDVLPFFSAMECGLKLLTWQPSVIFYQFLDGILAS